MIQLDLPSEEAQHLKQEMKTRLSELDPVITPADSKQFSSTGTNLKKRFPSSDATAWLRLRTTRAMRLLPLLLLYGSLTSVVATLAANLSTIDGTFNVEAYNSVGCLAMQPDGKLVVGGSFTKLGGQSRRYLGRVNVDGTLDGEFNPGAGGPVCSLAIQADGKVLVGGNFLTLGGQPRPYLGRLNTDGKVDPTFNPAVSDIVLCLASQTDGRMVVWAGATNSSGFIRTNLFRLNVDGTMDTMFNLDANGFVSSLLIQADGKIVVGGGFSSLGGQPRWNIGRLNTDGTADDAFIPVASSTVYCLAIQPDGKIVLGGNFTALAGESRSFIGRLEGNGTVDALFNPGADNSVNCFALQADGKIIVGGKFNTLGGQSCQHLGRLDKDGNMDSTFNPGVSNSVSCLAIQADGRVVVGGLFDTLGGQLRSCLGRLNNTTLATQQLSHNESTVTWLRGGSSPEVARVTFDYSMDGVSWERLGNGWRIADGWQLTDLSIRANATIRAWGSVANDGDSEGWMEQWIGLPQIGSQPVSIIKDFGSTVTFSVTLSDSALCQFQWYRNDVALTNAADLSGVTTSILTITLLSKADEGGYKVVVGNALGSVTSLVASLKVNDPVIATQPTNQDRELGQSGSFSVVAFGTDPLSYQWLKDGLTLANGTNLIGATNAMLTVNRLLETDAGDYTVVVGNKYGSLTSVVARMDLSWISVDATFNPGVNGSVWCLAIQADGKTVVGGTFGAMGGQTRRCLGRLNVDGTVDSTFNHGANGTVTCLAIQGDGKIVVGGFFSDLGGQSHTNIVRLNADGTVDGTFNPEANYPLVCLAIQADGKIVVGGGFSTLGGQTRQHLGRLMADGTVDSTFNPGASGNVNCLVIQADGKLVVGGDFISMGGQTCQYVGRLNVDGTVDSTFNPGANGSVVCLALQADGKIVVGGYFSSLSGQTCQYLGRLNIDGTFDSTFNPGANGSVWCLAVQADGKIVAGGYLISLGGQTRTYLGRLNRDGMVDTMFNLDANGFVSSLAIQADGKMVVGGQFNSLKGQPRNSLGRLINGEPATHLLNIDEQSVVWLRGGSSPEVSRVAFDYSTNGASWTPLGNGARIPGGWQLSALSLSTNGRVRARGTAVSGGENDWFVEQMAGFPFIALQPVSIVNNFGSNASFSVTSYGSEPLQYQWFKNGVALTNAANLSGVTSNNLTIAQASKTDEGSYSILVGNAFGNVTSVEASLTVDDPFISLQPTNQYQELGQSGFFAVVAGGTQPLHYQWLKDGLVLANGTNATGVTNSLLSINQLMETDAGAYTVVVGNQYGSVTSVVARMDLNLITADASFNPGANGGISCLAIQADGKVLTGGSFDSLGGQPRSCLGRLNVDGTIDAAFNPGANNSVECLAVQTDGKTVWGGIFTSLGGQSRTYIGRLNVDGTVDGTFNPGANGRVYCLAVQSDGKIVVGGIFGTLGGQSRPYLGRLNVDGTVDSTFNPAVSSLVALLAIQSDGKIVVGGIFSTLGGQSRPYLGRLNVDGTVDSTFNPAVNSLVTGLAIQADGKLVVGAYRNLSEPSRQYLGRLHVDGTVDATFNPVANNRVSCLAIQTDGKILVGGSFNTLGGQPRQYLGRLKMDGTVDSTFNPGANSSVSCLALQTDGKLVVGGNFSTLAGQSRSYIGRLNNSELATQQLGFDETTVVWLRGGTSPEVSRVTFDCSTNGYSWTSLGNGVRVPGGWQLTGLALSTNATIRARGAAISGGLSDWFMEQVTGVPFIAFQPVSIVNNFGSNVSFSVTSDGRASLHYQWFKDGVALTNAGNLSGVTTHILTIAQMSNPDEGGYSVVVENSFGSVTSLVASLTVNDPFIIAQPTNQYWDLGQSGFFTVAATGTQPLNYQWLKDGLALANGTNVTGVANSLLTINRLTETDAGAYAVVVGNQYGSLTSVVARMDLNLITADASFNPGVGGGSILCLAIQPDGKVLVGGDFSSLGGQSRRSLGRLMVDGTVDAAFKTNAANGVVNCLAIQPDGKVLVGGDFSSLGGQSLRSLGRLMVDGTVDAAFKTNTAKGCLVYCLAIQADGKIVVGGFFSNIGGQSQTNLGRLNMDGTVDRTFNPSVSGVVYCLAVQPDGKILVGGLFNRLGGQARPYLGRLNMDGTLDTTFNPGAEGYVYCLAVQPDGKILVGGYFSKLGAQARPYLGRLNGDGTLDTTFNPGANNGVFSLAMQTDGKVVVGGNFTALGGQTRQHLGRLNTDGTVDAAFNAGVNGDYCSCLSIQADGKIVVGGSFGALGGQPRSNIGRINNNGVATQQLSFNEKTVVWLRGGSSPEVTHATVDYSINGLDWLSLGNATRFVGGWQLTNVSISTNAIIRARGNVSGGGVSDWYVQTTIGESGSAMSLNIDRVGEWPVLHVTGGIGLQYVLEYAPVLSLTNIWQSTLLTLTNSPQVIIDETMTNANQRFYRLRKY